MQELYGFLHVHHAARHLMHQAAADTGRDPDRISFTRSLCVVRPQVTDQAAFPRADSPAPYSAHRLNWPSRSSHPADADRTHA